jgi:hypothetical protein
MNLLQNIAILINVCVQICGNIFSIVKNTIQFSIKAIVYIGCKSLEGILMLFIAEIFVLVSIMLTEHSSNPLARAWLQTLYIIIQAFLREAAVIIMLFLQ